MGIEKGDIFRVEKDDILQIDLNMGRFILAIIIFCLVAEAIIFFLDILYNLGQSWYFEKFQRVCNVDAEKSFGTWFSVVQNFVVAITALTLSMHYKFISDRKGEFFGWLLVALFFAYISLDEHLMLHENMGSTLPVFYMWIYGETITLPTYGWHFLYCTHFRSLWGLFPDLPVQTDESQKTEIDSNCRSFAVDCGYTPGCMGRHEPSI